MKDLLAIVLMALFVLPQTSSIKKCPAECTCDLDSIGRYAAICERGEIDNGSALCDCLRSQPLSTGNMKQIPIKDFDEEMNVIVIRKPKHTLTISPVFYMLKKLEILRIIESNVPAIGLGSFWGVPSLRLLGECRELAVDILAFLVIFDNLS
jgi:hypothetical protein